MSSELDLNISRDIEVKRTRLALLYHRKVSLWLQKNNKDHKMFVAFYRAESVLMGKAVGITLKMLEQLESFCLKFCVPQVVAYIELSSDDEDDTQPRNLSSINQSNETYHPEPAFSPEHSLNNSPFSDELEANNVVHLNPLQQQERYVSHLSPPSSPDAINKQSANNLAIHSVPRPVVDLPPAEILNLSLIDEPSTSSTTTAPKPPPQRRKSVNSKPTANQKIPSIATYQIKHNLLKPPAIYAKPSEQLNEARKIISVPYKRNPRQASTQFDPINDLTKLSGIKEKIYARNYLHLDAAKKDEMQKEFLEKEKEKESEETEDKSPTPPPAKNKNRRRKSMSEKPTASKKQIQQLKTPENVAQVKTSQNPVSSLKSRATRSKSFCLQRQVLDENDDDDSYVPPSHVLEDIGLDIAEIMEESAEVSSLPSSLHKVAESDKLPAKPLSSIASIEKPSASTSAAKSSISTSNIANPPALTSTAKLPIHPGKHKNQRRGGILKTLVTNSGSESTFVAQTSTISDDVIGAKISQNRLPVLNIFKKVANVAKKRGRPCVTNIVPQKIYAFPDSTFQSDSPPLLAEIQCKQEVEDFDEEGLLVEVEGKKRRAAPKRRNAIDEVLVTVKEEPLDE